MSLVISAMLAGLGLFFSFERRSDMFLFDIPIPPPMTATPSPTLPPIVDPSAGGLGWWVYVMVGVVVIAAAVIIWALTRRGRRGGETGPDA